jgi:multimeric flavodoxin WrbA
MPIMAGHFSRTVEKLIPLNDCEAIMKFFAINGSPRRKNNTMALLKACLKGVVSVKPKAETEVISLYNVHYSGCISCFACKKLEGKSYGQCKVKDELRAVLRKCSQADGLIFGSPIYFAHVTGAMRSFLERLLFQYYVYDEARSSLAPKKVPTACIYTMGANKEVMQERKYPEQLGSLEFFMEKVFSKPAIMYSCDTYQFDDYAKYKADCFFEPAKAKHRLEQFPKDIKEAFDIGVAMAKAAD